MRLRLALLVSAALLAGPALAADYEPPIVLDDAPEYVPVEVGSGWYLRGDLAYTLKEAYGEENDDIDIVVGSAVASYSEEEQMISGSLGFGYHFTDYLRTDLTVGFIPGNEIEAFYDDGVIAAELDVENSAWYGLANVYADLGTFAGVTPYVGAGAGVIRTKRLAEAAYLDTSFDPDLFIYNEDDAREYSYAYALHAGLAYNMGSNVSLDVGYQYLNAPEAEYVKGDSFTDLELEEGLELHQVKLGLRYDLW